MTTFAIYGAQNRQRTCFVQAAQKVERRFGCRIDVIFPTPGDVIDVDARILVQNRNAQSVGDLWEEELFIPLDTNQKTVRRVADCMERLIVKIASSSTP